MFVAMWLLYIATNITLTYNFKGLRFISSFQHVISLTPKGIIMQKQINKFLLALSILLLATSCVKDELEDCSTSISFSYTWNMFNVDYFHNQVDEVSLFVFDASGHYLKTIHEKGKHVQSPNFKMEISGVPNGNYHLVALAHNNRYKDVASYFELPKFTPSVSTMTNFLAKLKMGENNTYRSILNNHLLGYSKNVEINTSLKRDIIIPTKKINKALRVVLIETGSKEVVIEDYTIRIEDLDGNGVVKHDFDLLKGNPINYLPNLYKRVEPRQGEYNNKNESEKLNALAAEFSLSRLNESHNVRLIVEDKQGKTVLNKNLIDLIYLLKHEGYLPENMSFQEYLDRKDEFAISIYVEGDTSTWLKTRIIINGWVINLISIDF